MHTNIHPLATTEKKKSEKYETKEIWFSTIRAERGAWKKKKIGLDKSHSKYSNMSLKNRLDRTKNKQNYKF